MAAKFFDITIYNNSSIRQAFSDHNINGVNADQLSDLNTSDPPLLNEYYGYVTEQSLSLQYYLGLLVTQLNYARNLVPFLKKEYNLQ